MVTYYCKCRSTDSKGFMIACDTCEEWFHGKCIAITKKMANDIDKFYCDACKEKDPTLQTQYKPGFFPLPEKKQVSIKQEPLEERKQDKKVPDRSRQTSITPKPKPKPSPVDQSKFNQGKRKASQKSKSKGHTRKQCANPDCIYESRQDSKYCSDDCGYDFNRKRYETFFIPNWKELEKNHSQARLKKMKDLDQLEKDKTDVEQLIKNLKLEKEELEQNITVIKEQAKRLSKESINSRENDPDDAEIEGDDVEEIASGDLAKTFCISCGITIMSAKAFHHWSLCHKRQEALFAYTADVLVHPTCVEDENPKLYCHVQDKKTKRFCMNIEAACPQHSNWQGEKNEVCGCPVNFMQKLVPDGQYCLELKRDCTQHYHWDRFMLAQMNLLRVQAFAKLDSINDKMRTAAANLDDTYGGVVGVMLHKTRDGPEEVDLKQTEVDIEMVDQ